jgi:NADPH-dependent curcumin reductase CurA
MSMSNIKNRQWIFVERPGTSVGNRHFRLEEAAVPDLGPGDALVRVHWLGIDPTQRTWLNETETYISPARLGEVMPGSGVGQVVMSRSERLKPGDWVVGLVGWQDYVIAREEGLFGLNKVPDGIDPKAMLSVFGVNGLTAYFGMLDVGKLQAGDTVFVTGAAGGVGSVAGQIARIKGCRVIGSAGTAEKCDWVRDLARFDACINYRTESLREALKSFSSDGMNVVFDNVGGPALEAALDNLAIHARVVLSGSISSGYANEAYGNTPRNYMQLGFRRARMEGFIFLDYVPEFPKAFADLVQWVRTGEIQYAESVSEGLESAPESLAGLFLGRNLGKQMVRVVE